MRSLAFPRRAAAKTTLLVALLCAAPFPAFAQDATNPTPAKSLDQLLDLVREGWGKEREENRSRESRFKSQKKQQGQLLGDAKGQLAFEEKRSQQLEEGFEQNDEELAKLELTLKERLGTLGELFGVVRQVAGETRQHLESSLVSAQLGPRNEFLSDLGKSKALPSIAALRQLWFEMQREMTEQGKIVRFRAPVLTSEGREELRDVIRAGVFSAVSEGAYIVWEDESETFKLRELASQPEGKYLDTVAGFESATTGMAALAVDPARGSLLELLIETPDAAERIQQGGYVGYVIISLGILGALVGIGRWLMVTITARKVSGQLAGGGANAGNPLGRVIAVFEDNREMGIETLELKLDEAVLRESSRIERFQWFVKVVSVVAPLLGLLGTVTGMIQTFQLITLFGTGDPRMMAGGISQALVTTMLGLIVAIPMVLLHALLVSSTKAVIDVLDEQSAGLIAMRSEEADA
jgi:biopolymer transport protein ExbB